MARVDLAKQPETEKAPVPRRFLTVEAEHQPERVDLEMRGDLPMHILFPLLIRSLGWRLPDEEKAVPYRLVAVRDGQELDLKPTDTLISANVPSGATLRIMTGKPAGAKKTSGQDAALFPQPADGFTFGVPGASSPQERRGTISAPRLDQQVKEPSLISSSGTIFPIPGADIWIGRPDKTYKPEINLAAEDDRENPTCSRKHAQIINENGKYVLRAKPTLNGTFVNGNEIRPYENYVLREGDLVRLGDVELTFRLP
jgi:hypothetical protein